MKGLSLLKQSFTQTLAKFTAAGLFVSLVAIGAIAAAGPGAPPPGVQPMFQGAMLPDGNPRSVFMINLAEQVGQQLETITVDITPGAGSPVFTHDSGNSELLYSLNGSAFSGLSLWTSNTPNFDTYYATPVALDMPLKYLNNTLTFDIAGGGTPINEGGFFFVVVTPQDVNVKHGKAFTLGIASDGIVTSGTDPAFSATTINLSIEGVPDVKSLVSIDQNTNGTHLEAGDKLQFIFNQRMELGGVTASNVNLMFPAENNSFQALSYGTNPTVAVVDTFAPSDTLVITLGANPTIVNNAQIWPNVQATNNPSGVFEDPALIDLTGPVLKEVFLFNDFGTEGPDGVATKPGDVLMFVFDEAVDVRSLDPSQIDTFFPASAGTFGTTTPPNISLADNNMVKVQLNANQTNTVGATVNPSNAIKDLNGNKDATPDAGPTITVPLVSNLFWVGLSDIDNLQGGIDNADISVNWAPSQAEGIHYDVYLLPGSVPLDTDVHNRLNSSNIAGNIGSFKGSDSTYFLDQDSRFDFTAQNPTAFYGLDKDTPYKACVVVVADGSGDESLPTCSPSIIFSADAAVSFDNDKEPPFVTGISPFNGVDVSANLGQITVEFNEQLKVDTVNNSTVILEEDTNGDGTFDSLISTTTSVRGEWVNQVWVSLNAAPTEGNQLRLKLTNAITDVAGNSLPSNYEAYYRVGGSDSTAPKVVSASVAAGSVDVSPMMTQIGFNMNEPMLADTINLTNVTIAPVVSGSRVDYDVAAQAVILSFETTALEANTAYTVTLSSNCKDGASNALDGDGNGTGGDNYTLAFTTGAADMTAPDLMWADFTDFEIRAGFSAAMKQSSITNDSNWTITAGDGSRVSLSGANLFYNDAFNELVISGLNLQKETEYTLQAAVTVKGLNGVNIGTRSIVGTAHSNWDLFDSAKTDDQFMFGGGDIYSADMKIFSPVMVNPFDKRASTETTYAVSFPVTKSIPSGGKIVLTFPGSFLVANAQMVAVSESWINQDINGPGPNTITISNVAVNTINKTVTLTTNGGATGPNDYIDLDLKGITNGPASAVDWLNNTGGYTVSMQTKDANGAPLESNISSQRFAITEAGINTIAVTVHNSSNNPVAEDTAKVYLWGPTGELYGLVNASGVAQFTALPNGSYWASVESLNEDLANNFSSVELNVNAQNTNVARTIKLGSRGETMNLTLNHAGVGGAGTTEVEVYASSQSGWYEKTVTLDNDGATNVSMKVGAGEFFVGVRPAFKNATMTMATNSSKAMEMEFFQPTEQRIRVSTGTPASASFDLSVPNRTINVTVVDQNGNALNGADVWAYNPEGGMGGGGGITDATGKFALKVVDGVFKVGAWKDGMPQAPEKRVEVTSNTPTVEVTLKMMKATASVSGSVVDANSDPVQGVSVNCFSNQGYNAGAMTDVNGSYSMFLRGGAAGETYTCEAHSHIYGRMKASTGVDVTDFTVASAAALTGKNFNYAEADYNTIAGSVGLPDVHVWAIEKDANGNFINWGGGTNSEDDGTYLLRLPKNSVGNNYQLMAWSPDTGGDLVGPLVDISSASATGKDFVIGNRHTISVSVSNIPSGITEVFADTFNKTTYTGNGTPMTVSNGSATGTFTLSEGTYDARLWVPGFGEIAPDAPNNGEFVVSADKALTFDLTSLSGANTMTVSGTVKNSGGQGLSRAWVDMFNPQTGNARGMETAADGTWSLTVKAGVGNWFVTANKEGYVMSSDPQEITQAASNVNFTMTTADQTITGTVSDPSGTVSDAWVWAENGTGGFSGDEVSPDGTYTLNVTAGTWNVCAATHRYEDCVAGVVSGTTQNITLSTQLAHFDANKKPVNTPIVPTQGGTVDAEGFKVAVPANALGDSSSGTLAVSPTASPKGATKKTVGGAYEITATSGGSSVNSLQNNVDITLEYTKTTMDALVDAGDLQMNARANDAEKLTAAYLNGTDWVPIATTKKIQVKEDSDDSFTAMDYNAAMTALEANNDVYYDYKILVEASTDHFTVFGTITGSDSTPPATPTGLSTVSSSGQVVVDWADNGEGDFMEYLIFRSTSSGFTPADGNQINLTQLTASTYTDTGLTNGTTYYYVVKAVDTSGNESTATSEATGAPTAGTPVTVTFSSGGSGSSANNDDDDDEDAIDADAEAADEDATDAEDIDAEDDSADTEVAAGYDVAAAVAAGPDYAGHWAETYIEEVLDLGLASGYNVMEYRPDNAINRAEFIKMIVLAAEYDVEEELGEAPFKDVSVNMWYAPYIAAAKEEGLIAGYSDGTFKPQQEINRAEAMKIVAEALLDMPTLGADTRNMLFELGLWSNPFGDVSLDDWFAPYVLYAYSEGVVSGYKAIRFAPEKNLTRAEFAKILVLALDN